MSAGATNYFDSEDRAGVGLVYEAGRTPDINFALFHRTAVSLKIKLDKK